MGKNKWYFLTLCVVGSLGFVGCEDTPEDPMEAKKKVLPIVGERDVEYKMVDGVEVTDTIYHRIPEFEYINQDSVWVKSEDFKDKVWVTDFFFTKCPTICPPMTSQMHRLAKNTSDLDDYVQFFSFSIDPERDTPAQLRTYIEAYDIQKTNWLFLTGVPEFKTHLMAKEYFNGAEKNDAIDGGYGHTSYFTIVDKEGFVRGIYDGTNSDQVDQLEKDLRKLLTEEYKVSI